MTAFFARTAVRERREKVGEDDYGNDLFETTQTTIERCEWQPRSSSENVSARDQLVSGLMFYAPEGTDLRHTDALLLDGERYEVDGDVGRWSGVAIPGYVETALRRVTG